MKKIVVLVSLFFIFILCIVNINNTKALEIEEKKIAVDIKGAVENPGLYEVDNDITVYELIGIAGGLKSYADTSLINLSKRLNDQDVVIVYTIDEVLSLTSGDTAVKVVEKECMCPKIENVSCINTKKSSKTKTDIGIININTATKEELQKLNSIGAAKADAIIEYRNKTPFTKPEDIMNVKGIGKSIYEKNKDNIGV